MPHCKQINAFIFVGKMGKMNDFGLLFNAKKLHESCLTFRVLRGGLLFCEPAKKLMNAVFYVSAAWSRVLLKTCDLPELFLLFQPPPPPQTANITPQAMVLLWNNEKILPQVFSDDLRLYLLFFTRVSRSFNLANLNVFFFQFCTKSVSLPVMSK